MGYTKNQMHKCNGLTKFIQLQLLQGYWSKIAGYSL